MDAPTTALTALTSPDAQRCPLCGGLNQCTPAATGDLKADCWCRTARIPPEVLARIPVDQRMQACLCPACATGSQELQPGGHQAGAV